MSDKNKTDITSRETISNRLQGRMGDGWLPHQNNRDFGIDRQAFSMNKDTSFTEQRHCAYFPNPGATSQPMVTSPNEGVPPKQDISIPNTSRPFTNNHQEDLINERMQLLQPLPQGVAYPVVKNTLYQFNKGDCKR